MSRTAIPSTLRQAVINPRLQVWTEHFLLNGPEIAALSPEGRVTVAILQMNHADRITERTRLIQVGHYP